MRILIVEDEHYAAKRLQSMVLKELPDAKVLAVIDTVEEAVSWLAGHVEPSLIFMDIQLADGLSFQIFDQVKVTCPVIFVTAFDEYALNAFKVNSIDYLLKPIKEEDLRAAINKYQQFFPTRTEEPNWNGISKEILQPKSQYKQRFLIKVGSAYQYLNTEDIDLLFSEDGLSFAVSEKKKVVLDESLEKISEVLDPNAFFKISRKHIVSLKSIVKIHPYLNNRLKLETSSSVEEELVVSREKVKAFKAWLDR